MTMSVDFSPFKKHNGFYPEFVVVVVRWQHPILEWPSIPKKKFWIEKLDADGITTRKFTCRDCEHGKVGLGFNFLIIHIP